MASGTSVFTVIIVPEGDISINSLREFNDTSQLIFYNCG